MSELQRRRDAQTRAELSETAISLFAQNGFAETTMDDVANAAGTSRRTVYRHYGNKEDLVFEQTRLWMEVFNDVTAERLPMESTRDLCHRAILAVTAYIDVHREEVLPGYGVVAVTPALHNRYARTNREWFERYVEIVSADITDGDQDLELQASILAGALVGGTDGAVRTWFTYPDAELSQLIETVLAQVEPLWPDASRLAGR